jgi:hypothetical protein
MSETTINSVIVICKSVNYVNYIINREIKKTVKYDAFRKFVSLNFPHLFVDVEKYLNLFKNFVILVQEQEVFELLPDNENEKDFYVGKKLGVKNVIDKIENKETDFGDEVIKKSEKIYKDNFFKKI